MIAYHYEVKLFKIQLEKNEINFLGNQNPNWKFQIGIQKPNKKIEQKNHFFCSIENKNNKNSQSTLILDRTI